MIEDEDLVSLLPAGHSIGSIRTKRPLLYVFSGGNEDAAFFSVNGFSVLFDGGDRRDVPYWNLIRNYDKISAAIVTRMSPQCMKGISSILVRKSIEECHPNFGAIICNLPPTITSGNSEMAAVLRAMDRGLRAEGLKPIEAFASAKMEPITLYEVIGEGALRMIVLNPERGSKDFTSFTQAVKTGEALEKHAASTSLALLLVWHPADRTKPVTRVLVTGSCPLEKLYTSLEKLKREEYLRYPEYIAANREKSHGSSAPASRLSHGGQTTRILKNPIHTSTNTTTTTRQVRTSLVTPTKAHGGEETVKKIIKQPLHGAAASRLMTGPKKPLQTATTTKPAAVKSSTDNHKDSKKSPPKSAMNEPKNISGNAVSRPKAKNGIPKPEVKTTPEPVKPEEPKLPSESPLDAGNVNPGCQHGDAPTVPADQPDQVIPTDQKDTEITEIKRSEPEPIADDSPLVHDDDDHPPVTISTSDDGPEPPIAPNNLVDDPDKNLLLDGIEEPMKLRRISMDYTDEAANNPESQQSNDNLQQGECTGLSIHGALDNQPQETVLLDSTPSEPSATSIPSNSEIESCEGENEDEKLEMARRDSMKQLLGAGVSPFTAGFASCIVVDTSGVIPKVVTNSNDQNVVTQGNQASDQTDSTDAAENNSNKTLNVTTVERATYQMKSSASSDSVNAVTDPALDDVIDTLAVASEMVDSVNNTVSDLTARVVEEHEKQDARNCNNFPDAFATQHAYESANAKEFYLPPVSGEVRPRAKLVTNGSRTKPKLTQPVYFDIVFVPHQNSNPLLKDEESARAFVSSVRSRRYVMSGQEAIRTSFLEGLISGKNSWNSPELEVDVLPTHDSEELAIYGRQKIDELSEAGINLRCSVERCTLRLSSGGSDDVCAAFKFEL